MQRWTRSATWGIAASVRVSITPAYVDRRVTALSDLRRMSVFTCKGTPTGRVPE
jgi:hypothetical protein